MRVSKVPVNSTLNEQVFMILHQTLADLKNPQEVDTFLKSFLKETEHAILAKRLAVAYWLQNKRTYRHISQELKVSTATISEVQHHINELGVKLAVKKIRTQEWVNEISQKIRKFVKVGRKQYT